MAKNKNQGLYIMIGIIVAAFIIAPNLNFEFFSTINQDTFNQLDNAPAGSCSLILDKNVVNVGEEAGGVIRDGKNTFCEIYGTDGTTWTKVGEGTTNANGDLRYSDTIYISGTFSFRAICGSCVTNLVDLIVNPIDDGDDDAEGVEDIIDNTGGSGGGSVMPGQSDLTTGITVDWVPGGPFILGVRIYRSWDYMPQQDPNCINTVFPEVMEFTFYDSNGMRWQKYDELPTTEIVELCPVNFHEDSLWKFEVRNSKDYCDVAYTWSIETFICGVLD